uniref:lipocalin family protein n=1 Tax=Thaumasiovibrio occultus TaxID=1891184 RepID=UPI000B3516F0|nr:lipocalin family protein [Thaumasiovibrio occultus]
MVVRYLSMFVLLLSSMFAKAEDITSFEFPFLIGDWYWFSPTDEGVGSEGTAYRAMHIQFSSDYDYMVRLLEVDGDITGWRGTYDIDEGHLLLKADGQPDQLHAYKLSYNQFQLDGARFTKLAPENLPGYWVSSNLSGEDLSEDISRLDINLRPDFLFSFIAYTEDGQSTETRGIYFIEDGQIVLIYEGGQHDSRYTLASDTLTLSNEQVGMKAVFERQ